MRDLTIATTQDLDEPVYHEGDENLLMVVYTSEWDSGDATIESNATLNLSTGEVISLEVEEYCEDLDILDREFISIGDREIELDDQCLDEESDDLKEIQVSLKKIKMTQTELDGMLDMLKNGLSFEFENGAAFEADTKRGYIDLITDEPLTVERCHHGYHDLSMDGLKLALKDSDLFPYGSMFEPVENENALRPAPK